MAGGEAWFGLCRVCCVMMMYHVWRMGPMWVRLLGMVLRYCVGCAGGEVWCDDCKGGGL